MEKESNWLWVIHISYFAMLYWIGSTHFHNKHTVVYFIVILAAAFLVAPLFKFFWLIDRTRRK